MSVRYETDNGALIAHVVEADLHEVLDLIRTTPQAENDRILRSVSRALDAAIRTMLLRELTEKERQNAADDVAIWFANEVANGRATFVADVGPDPESLH